MKKHHNKTNAINPPDLITRKEALRVLDEIQTAVQMRLESINLVERYLETAFHLRDTSDWEVISPDSLNELAVTLKLTSDGISAAISRHIERFRQQNFKKHDH